MPEKDYDAFISYARASDEQFAPKLKEAMLKLGKKWNQRRALNVFLDQTSLEASSGLRDSLQGVLDRSRFLVILASPESAGSRWVGEEVEHWTASGKSWEQIRLVLTKGTIFWDDAAGDFDFAKSSAVGEGLRGVFPAEPLFLDMAEFREAEALDIRADGRWKDRVATLAAPIHPESGNPPQPMTKEDLVGADLVQFRRAKRLRKGAITGLALLTVVATIAGILALIQRDRARTEARLAESRAMAAQALNNAETDRDLSALLALESIRVADTSEARGSLLGILGFPSRFQERTNEHPDQSVTAVAFDSTGTLAATGDTSGKIVMWRVNPEDPLNPATVREGFTLDLAPNTVGALLFLDEDGETRLIAASDDELILVDVETGERLDGVPTPEFPGDFAASSDLSLLVGQSDDVLIIKDIDGNEVGEVPLVDGGSSEVTAAAVAQGDPPLVAWVESSEDAQLIAMREPSRNVPVELENPFVSEVTSMAFSPDGSLLVVGEADGAIWLYDADTGMLVGTMEPAPVTGAVDLVFDPNPDPSGVSFTLASAHTNGEILLWEVFEDGGLLVDRLLGHNDVITSLAFGAGGQIGSGSFEGEVIWWSAVPQFVFGNTVPSSGERHQIDVAEVAFLDDDIVVSRDIGGNLLLTSVFDGEGQFVPGIPPGAVTKIAATADKLAVGLVDGSVLLVIGEDDRTLDTAHTELVELVELSDNGRGLVTGSSDAISIWDAETGDRLSSPDLPDDFEPFSALHSGEDVVWLGGRDSRGPVALRFEASTGRGIDPPLRHGTAEQPGALAVERVVSMAVSSDGKLLVTGGSDRKIHAWDLDTGERSGGSFVGHNEDVTGLAFIENDEQLVSADRDLVVNYWDVSDRRLITSFGGPGDGISDLALSPNGLTLAVASEDDFVHTWTLDTAEWVARACLLAGRNMTSAEWDLYGRGSYVRHCDYPGEGPLADYGGLVSLTSSAVEPSSESSAGAGAPTIEAPTETEPAASGPSASSATTNPPPTATSPTTSPPPPTTSAQTQGDDPEVFMDDMTFELGNQEFDAVEYEVPDGSIQLAVSIGETSSPDVDLFVFEPGMYVPGSEPNASQAVCASNDDGSEESCIIDGVEPGPWTVVVWNFEASDVPPDLIDVLFDLVVE